MTEPIMIDGVDVSGCDNYKTDGRCRIPQFVGYVKLITCNCDIVENCYFKELQRKTAELEETITEANIWIHKYAEQQRKLYIATEALKKIIKIHKDDTNLKWVQELQQALEQIGAEE